jgi:hypothetical protein
MATVLEAPKTMFQEPKEHSPYFMHARLILLGLVYTRGYKEMSSILGGGEGGCVVSANENSCAYHVTWSTNKLWRSNSIFNL